MSAGPEKLGDLFCVSRETIDRLLTYEDLIKKWNPTINLVATSTLNTIWDRHFLESAQLFDFAGSRGGLWVDLGTGGGFPGMVVAILASDMAPDIAVTCIESDIRKCEFLRAVSRTVQVPLAIMSRRIEEAPPQNAATVSARALSGLDKLLGYASRHLHKTGNAVFMKGETWKQEVKEARKNWRFDLETAPSLTSPASALLKLRNIEVA